MSVPSKKHDLTAIFIFVQAVCPIILFNLSFLDVTDMFQELMSGTEMLQC
ncbi:hypothetical protein Hanom_Chr15g01371951 [Helianthus anomalus]